MDGFGGSDVLLTRISVLFVIVIVTILLLCVGVDPCGVVGGDLLGIDVLEEAAILHAVIGFGMKLVGTLQGLVVAILVIAATTWLLNRVDFMIVLAGTLASVVITAVASPITVVLGVMVVVALITTIAVVVLTMVIAIVIAAQWVFRE
jgi:hypothetical protein